VQGVSPTRARSVRARTWLVAGVVVLLIAAIAICYRTGSVRTTKITIYQPTGFKATEEADGQCWTGSLAAPRAGAYRCAVGNSIFDPCFATNGAVACPVGDPAENQGLLIRLTEPLPTPPDAWENPPDPANPSPWDMRLLGGGYCGVLTGTRPPEFPLGCTIPEFPEGALCSMPVPLAHRAGIYATTCGVWNGEELLQPRIYFVTRMWL
jgi:hypothetical protein